MHERRHCTNVLVITQRMRINPKQLPTVCLVVCLMVRLVCLMVCTTHMI